MLKRKERSGKQVFFCQKVMDTKLLVTPLSKMKLRLNGNHNDIGKRSAGMDNSCG